MNRLFTGIFFLFILGLAAGCKKSDDDDILQGDWTRMADFEDVPRSGAVSFVIGDKAYVGTGYKGKSATKEGENSRLSDFWMYNSATDNWTKIANFPGVPRSYAVAFAANGKGYVGLGTSDGTNTLKDFWEYDPSNNSWRQVADFNPTNGKGRVGAVAFAIGNEGFVGSGNDGDNDQQDFYKFTPPTSSTSMGTWAQVSSIKSKRRDAFAFVIGNKAYVGGGYNNGYVYTFYSYNASSDTWTTLHSLYPDTDPEESDDIKSNDDYNYNLERRLAVAFSINGLGYITTGTLNSYLNNTWQYDPNKDIWEQVDTFEGTSRQSAVGFAIGNLGYIATGESGTTYMDDLWKYDPNTEDDD